MTFFLDIGANVGYWSILLSNHFENVISFEPNPELLSRLTKNIELNNLKNIQVHRLAISDTCGEAKFFIRKSIDNSGSLNDGLGSIVTNDHLTESEIIIKTMTLDSLNFSQLIRLIKIDVEGAEELVLGGAQETLKRHMPIVISEVLFNNVIDREHILIERSSFFPDGYMHFFWCSENNELLPVDFYNAPSTDFNLISIPKKDCIDFGYYPRN